MPTGSRTPPAVATRATTARIARIARTAPTATTPLTVRTARTLLLAVGTLGLAVFCAVAARSLASGFGDGTLTPGVSDLSDALAWSFPQLICGVIGLCTRAGHRWAPAGAAAAALALGVHSVFMGMTGAQRTGSALELAAAAAAAVLLATPAARRHLTAPRLRTRPTS